MGEVIGKVVAKEEFNNNEVLYDFLDDGIKNVPIEYYEIATEKPMIIVAVNKNISCMDIMKKYNMSGYTQSGDNMIYMIAVKSTKDKTTDKMPKWRIWIKDLSKYKTKDSIFTF